MKTIIFDLDGTLADTSEDLLNAANSCFKKLGLDGTLNLIDHSHIALKGGRALLKAGFELAKVVYNESDITREYPLFIKTYEENLSVHTFFYPRVRETILALKNSDFLVGICTNKPEYLAEKLLVDLNFRQEFGSLVGADTIAFKKPHPEPYIEAVQRCGGEVKRSLLVGDTLTDYDTARAARVPIVLVDFGPGKFEINSLSPDAFLSDYRDLLEISNTLIP